jgi:capsid protein
MLAARHSSRSARSSADGRCNRPRTANTYEQLTGDLTQVNYSSIWAGLLEFRRRVESLQHGVIVHQLCRPIWQAWMAQAVLEGALTLTGYASWQRQTRSFDRAGYGLNYGKYYGGT